MKKIFMIIAILIITLLVLAVAKDQVIKSAVSVAATTVTGAKTQIDGFSLGLFKQAVRIKGFKMYNPEGFPKEVFIDIPVVSVDYDLGALLKKKLHLRSVDVDIKEMTIIKNKDKKLNINSLKVAEKKEKPKEIKETKASEQMAMQIDELKLNVGKVVYKDYSAGGTPSVQVYDVGLKNKKYNNITSAQQLVSLIVMETLKPTAIQGAASYGVATLLGVGFLPAGIAVTLAKKDSSEKTFNIGFDKVYVASLKTLKEIGNVTSENKEQGIIKATVDKNDVTVKVEKKTNSSTQVIAGAKRLLIPKPETAAGVLYQISENLK